jgi:hypothetical protein
MSDDGKQINELDNGSHWSVAGTGKTVIKYSYLSALPTIYQGLPPEEGYTTFQALSSANQAVIKSALDYLETILNVDFQDVTGVETGAITFGWVDGPPEDNDPTTLDEVAHAFYPNHSTKGGDVWFNKGNGVRVDLFLGDLR